MKRLLPILILSILLLNTNYSLNEILREKLHTSIHLNQPENILVTYGGSAINLPKNLNSVELTSLVVELIGNCLLYTSPSPRD